MSNKTIYLNALKVAYLSGTCATNLNLRLSRLVSKLKREYDKTTFYSHICIIESYLSNIRNYLICDRNVVNMNYDSEEFKHTDLMGYVREFDLNYDYSNWYELFIQFFRNLSMLYNRIYDNNVDFQNRDNVFDLSVSSLALPKKYIKKVIL